MTDWEQTFDAVSDPICILAPDYRVLRANAAYRRLFGVTHGGPIGHRCFALEQGQAGPCDGCPLPHTLQMGGPAYVQQERMVLGEAGGEPERRVFQAWTYPVLGADGRVERAIEILKDVTDQERLRAAMNLAEALREADRLRAELLGTVSHELRTPLTAIKGYASTLVKHERRLPREERREYLRAIEGACDRLEVIIDRLLQMSELEAGGVHLDPGPVDLVPIVRAALAEAERRVAAAGDRAGPFAFQLRLVDGEGAPASAVPIVRADPRSLRDVLDNLLENAIKYSPQGGEVEVTLCSVLASARPYGAPAPAGDGAGPAPFAPDAPHAPDRPMLEIRVRDGGQGIPAEHLARIFDPFHRVDARLTREVDGLGLGLAICRRLVERHGGAIWAESRPGAGSVFHVTLPLDAEAVPVVPDAAPRASGPHP
jgi:signal transduction histidine kinase